ncbi:helix-turn-helix domain-containing protein [Luteimonas sp. R10]|uniref:helix-turn-helix domain-containing protein n=1 Tax=Luteimonas sp. R10 TaxID=3108176 RepID=UPI0038901AD7
MRAACWPRTGKKVLRVAQDVGYESEAAFSRAFRRTFGVPPGQYRRERKAVQPLRGAAAEPA